MYFYVLPKYFSVLSSCAGFIFPGPPLPADALLPPGPDSPDQHQDSRRGNQRERSLGENCHSQNGKMVRGYLCAGCHIHEPRCIVFVFSLKVLEKMRPLDHKLKYQIDKLVRTAVTGSLGKVEHNSAS